MVAWYRLEISSITVNLAQICSFDNYRTGTFTFPLHHDCDIRGPVYSMTSSKWCTVALFMKDAENVKNYYKTEVEQNSILPRAYHVIDGLWFIATQNTLTFTAVFPQKQKQTLIVNPPLGIIKLNMSCTATNSYLTWLHITTMKTNQTCKITLNFIMGLTSNFGNHSSLLFLISHTHKKICLQYWHQRGSHETFDFLSLQA